MADPTFDPSVPQETRDNSSAEEVTRNAAFNDNDTEQTADPGLATRARNMLSSGWQNAKVSLLSQFPVIGPHGSSVDEAELLLSGKKPLGWINVVPNTTDVFHTQTRRMIAMEGKLDDAIRDGRLISKDVVVPQRPPGGAPWDLTVRFYAQPGNEQDLATMAAYHEKFWNGEKPDVKLDKSFGDYLGYRKRDQMLFQNLEKYRPYIPHSVVSKLFSFNRDFAQPAYLESLLGHSVDRQLTLPEQAAKGDVVAQLHLGNMFQYGLDTQKNNGEALAWYTRAAASGSPVAQSYLGQQYVSGALGPQDPEEGAKWLNRAVEQGYPPAMTSLGNLHLEGRGVPQDDARALALFRRGAELGDVGSQGALGKLYAEGRGVPQDNVEAGFWYKLAAKARPDFPLGGEFIATLTSEQSDAVNARIQSWEAMHPSSKEVLKAQLKNGAATVDAPKKPVPEEQVAARMPQPLRKVHPFETYLNTLAAQATLAKDVALSPGARKMLVENSDTFLASLDPVSKLRVVKALDTISQTPDGKKLVDQFIESGVPLKLDPTAADTGGHFRPDYALQPEGNVAAVPVHVQASAFTSQGRLTNVLTHELEHLNQARNNNLTPLSLGKIPGVDDIILHNRFIEADAQATATDVAYRLKLQGDPEAWNALHALPDHRAIADAYEAAVQRDPAALDTGYAKRAAFDGWFTAKGQDGTTLVDYYNNKGGGWTAGDRYIAELMKNGAKPVALTQDDYKRLGAQGVGVNYLDLPGARPLKDGYYAAAGEFTVQRAEQLQQYRETYAKAQEAYAKGEIPAAGELPASERNKGAGPVAWQETDNVANKAGPKTEAFNDFLRAYRRGTAYVEKLPGNAKIALDTPSALVTSIPRVAQLRLNGALDDIASVPGGAPLAAVAKEGGVSLRMNNDPLQRGGEIQTGASGEQEIHLQGYSTKGALVLQTAQHLQNVRQAKAGLLSPFKDGLRSPEEAMLYEQFRNADAQATATEVAYRLKLAGKTDAWKALQQGDLLPAGLATAYEKAIQEDPAALGNGRAKRAAFDASFAAEEKAASGYDAALRHYPSPEALADMMDGGKPVKALSPEDLKKFGALSDVNYLDIAGERPLDDTYYKKADLNARQEGALSRLRARFNTVAPRLDPAEAKTVLLQHGTSEANLKGILDNGFQPRYRSARDKVRDVVKRAVPEADVDAKVTEVLEKSSQVNHRAHEVSDVLYTTSDGKLASDYAIKVANSGGEVKGQIYRTLGIPYAENPYNDARPVRLMLRAPTEDVMEEDGQKFRALAWGDATIDSSHEVLLKQKGGIEVMSVVFAKKEGDGWSFEGQPFLTLEEARKEIQPQFARPAESVPVNRNRRAILKDIVDVQLGPDVKITQPDATYVAETTIRDEKGFQTRVRVPDPSFEPWVQQKFGQHFTDTAMKYKMPYDLTPVEMNGYLTALDIKEQRGDLTAQEKHARLEHLYDEMERINPELKAVTVDRSSPLKVADAVHGVVNDILPRDIQFHLRGAPRTAEYEELSRPAAGTDWNFSPETLTNIQQQMVEKNRAFDQWMTEQTEARNRAAQAETGLQNTESPSVKSGTFPGVRNDTTASYQPEHLSNEDVEFLLKNKLGLRHVSDRQHLNAHFEGRQEGDAYPLSGAGHIAVNQSLQDDRAPLEGTNKLHVEDNLQRFNKLNVKTKPVIAKQALATDGDFVRQRIEEMVRAQIEASVKMDGPFDASQFMLVKDMHNADNPAFDATYPEGKCGRQEILPNKVVSSMALTKDDLQKISAGATVEDVLTDKVIRSIKGLRTEDANLVEDVRKYPDSTPISGAYLEKSGRMPPDAAEALQKWSVEALRASVGAGDGDAARLDALAGKAIEKAPSQTVEILSAFAKTYGAEKLPPSAKSWMAEGLAHLGQQDPEQAMRISLLAAERSAPGDGLREVALDGYSKAAAKLTATQPERAAVFTAQQVQSLPKDSALRQRMLEESGKALDALAAKDPTAAQGAVEQIRKQYGFQKGSDLDIAVTQKVQQMTVTPTVSATQQPAIQTPEQAQTAVAPGNPVAPAQTAPSAGQAPAVVGKTPEIKAVIPVTESPAAGQPRPSKFLPEQHQNKISPAPKGKPSKLGGTGAGVVGVVLSAQGLKQAIETHDKLEMGIGGLNLATSGVQTAESILETVGKSMPAIKGAAKFVPGLNAGVTVVDGVYQISKEDTREHKVQRGVAVGATAATGFVVGAAATAVVESAAVTGGIAAVAGTSAIAAGAAAFAVAAAPVVLTAAAVIAVGYVGNKVIEARREWEKSEKARMEEAKPQKRAGYVSPDGKPSVMQYKHIALEMMRVSPDMKDQNLNHKPGRDKNNRILVDDIKKMDMSDPKNRAEFERALELNIKKQQEIMKANDSFLPQWMRTSGSAGKYADAQTELGNLTAAKAEMDMYQKDLQAYQKAHPEQAKTPDTGAATKKSAHLQKLNS